MKLSKNIIDYFMEMCIFGINFKDFFIAEVTFSNRMIFLYKLFDMFFDLSF